MVSPIPPGMESAIPYMTFQDCKEALAFYEKAFGAELLMSMPGPNGEGTLHAEMRVLGSIIMMTDENPQWNLVSAKTLGNSPVSLMFYCEDADAVFEKAAAAGCEVVGPCMDMFWGDRMGKLQDPFGYQWAVATHIEDVSDEEMPARHAEWLEKMQGECG